MENRNAMIEIICDQKENDFEKTDDALKHLSSFIFSSLGPFAHLLEHFLKVNLENYQWSHREAQKLFSVPQSCPLFPQCPTGFSRPHQIIENSPPSVPYRLNNLVIFVVSSFLGVVNNQIMSDFIQTIFPVNSLNFLKLQFLSVVCPMQPE